MNTPATTDQYIVKHEKKFNKCTSLALLLLIMAPFSPSAFATGTDATSTVIGSEQPLLPDELNNSNNTMTTDDLASDDFASDADSNISALTKAATLSVTTGIFGVGPELSYTLTPTLTVRTSLQSLKMDHSISESSIDYQSDLSLNTFHLVINWYPLGGDFYLSGGLIRNTSSLSLASEPQGSYTVGDTTYEGDLNLSGNIDFPTIAPYFGLGWNHLTTNRLTLYSNIGIALVGEPALTVNAEGLVNEQGSSRTFDVSTDETFQQNLGAETADLSDSLDLDKFQILPSANIGIGFRF